MGQWGNEKRKLYAIIRKQVNKNISFSNLQNTAKATVRRKLIVLNAFNADKNIENNGTKHHLKKLEREYKKKKKKNTQQKIC